MSQEYYKPARINQPVILDGYSNEAAWENINPLPLTMYTPQYKGDLTERTEIRIAYDDQYIYASARCYDSDPAGIRGNSLERDGDNGGDFFNLLLDTFNDNETFVTFSTTPAGNRLDAEIINDAEGGFDFFWSGSWNTFWDNAVVKTDSGWFAEIRIPFSSLRFKDDDGTVTFGFIVHRLIGRKNERQIYPSIPPNWDFGAWKASQAKKIIFEGIYHKKPLFVTPYLLLGHDLVNQVISDSEFNKDSEFKKEAGLDLKYGLSNNLNLDLTINTDFAQVEADDQQLNLSRFSLFFPEKRQFFQERAGIFKFSLGDQDRLFYSRKIGISQTGEPLRMYGGLRLTGRINNLDIGLISTQIAENSESPSENFGVLRLKQRVFNDNSFIGGLATTRIGTNGNHNITYGLDGIFRLTGLEYLTVKTGQSFGSGLSTAIRDNSFGYLMYERRAVNNLGYQFTINRNGASFNPSVGFIQRSNFTAFSQFVWYGFFIDQSKFLRVVTPWVFHQTYYRNGSFDKETDYSELAIKLDMKTGTNLLIYLSNTYDQVLSGFALSQDAMIPAGSYRFQTVAAQYTMTPGRPLRSSIMLEAGEFYDGDRRSITLSPAWNPNKHFGVSGDFVFSRVEFKKRGQTFKGNIQRMRVNLAWDTHLSFNGLVQLNQLDKLVGINLRLRYNFREGNDLFMVYNRSVSTENRSELPDLRSQSLIIKYTYTFINR